MHGERRTRGAPAPAPLLYPDAALPLANGPDVQAAPLTDVAATAPRMRLNPFDYFTEDGQKANWIFAQFERSRADSVQGKTTHCEWSHFHIARVCFPTGTLLNRHCA